MKIYSRNGLCMRATAQHCLANNIVFWCYCQYSCVVKRIVGCYQMIMTDFFSVCHCLSKLSDWKSEMILCNSLNSRLAYEINSAHTHTHRLGLGGSDNVTDIACSLPQGMDTRKKIIPPKTATVYIVKEHKMMSVEYWNQILWSSERLSSPQKWHPWHWWTLHDLTWHKITTTVPTLTKVFWFLTLAKWQCFVSNLLCLHVTLANRNMFSMWVMVVFVKGFTLATTVTQMLVLLPKLK